MAVKDSEKHQRTGEDHTIITVTITITTAITKTIMTMIILGMAQVIIAKLNFFDYCKNELFVFAAGIS